MSLNDTDLERIAASLSGEHGTFPVSNLVNYGNTIILRPGARTMHGVVFSGSEVAAMLPSDFTAFPLAVEYTAEAMPDLNEDLMGLYADALGADTLGATAGQSARLRARYARVVERFRYWLSGKVTAGRAAAALATGGLSELTNRKKMAGRVLLRLKKIWERMGKLGVDRAGLVPPARLEAELLGFRVAPRVRMVPAQRRFPMPTRYPATRPTAMPMPVTPSYAPTLVAPTVTPPTAVAPVAPVAPAPAQPGYTPVSKKVSPYYYRDQAALEEELSQGAPSYGGTCYYGASDYAMGQEDLAADLRAETIGYLFSAMEHDYYGIDGGEDVEFTSADFRALFGRDVGERLAAFGADGLDGLTSSSMVDLLDGVVSSERLLGLADQMGAVRPALARKIRRKARAQMNAAHLAKIGLEDADEDIEDSDADAEEPEADTKAAPKKSAELDKTQAKAANLQRRVLLPSVSDVQSLREGKNVLDKTQKATKLFTQLTDALRSIAPNGSVNYGRLTSCSGAYGTEPIIVIGIQRKTGISGDLLDLIYEQEVRRVPSGYDAADAVTAITQNTSVSDYLGQDGSNVAYMNDVEEAVYGAVLYGADEDLLGLLVEGSRSTLVATMNEAEDAIYGPVFYGAANAYPDGQGSPLPPPRRVGAEVYGA